MKRVETSSVCKAVLKPLGVNKRIIKIKELEFSIGRSPGASHIIRDIGISRSHCIIKCLDGLWYITDQSTLGTFVNDNKLPTNVPHPLKSDDVVRLGNDKEFAYIFNIVDETPDMNSKKRCYGSAAKEVDAVCNAEPTLSRKQMQLQLKIEQTQHETSIMETEHSQLEANLQNELDLIEKRYEAEEASLMRRSACWDNRQKVEEERLALEQQFIEEKEELVRSMTTQMEELQKKIYDKQQVELRLTFENQQLQEELMKERILFKERLQKEEEQVQLERQKVQELQQKHQEAIASLEEEYTITGILQEREMAEKSKAYEEERKTIESALLEKEKALEVTEEKLKKEGEVRNKFQDVLESELQCSICSELFVCAITLNCTHTFCQLCIAQWKERKKDCPVCRTVITSETRVLQLDGFIDRAVDNLSEELKSRRKEIIEERKAAMLVYQQKSEASGSAAPRRATRQNTRGRRTSSRARRPRPTAVAVVEPRQEEAIYLSSADDDEQEEDEYPISLSDTDSDSSVEGEPGAFYGGYGYCYRCGRRGHWARGCPNY